LKIIVQFLFCCCSLLFGFYVDTRVDRYMASAIVLFILSVLVFCLRADRRCDVLKWTIKMYTIHDCSPAERRGHYDTR
jgi:hypothetical protein